jgi:hypothetical protein
VAHARAGPDGGDGGVYATGPPSENSALGARPGYPGFVPSSPNRPAIPSWIPGRSIELGGRTRLIVLGGIGSRTGDAQRAFGPMAQHLGREGGYEPRRDLLEGSYAGRDVAGAWAPRPYLPADTRQPLLQSAEAFAGALEWYRAALPDDTRFCLLGYSMGGVVTFDGATMAVARDRAGWKDRLSAVITFASPLRGTSAGAFLEWAPLVTDHDLGAAGRDLDRRWSDQAERERVERRAAFLRASGVRLLTLADPDDAVVRPEEALLPDGRQQREALLVRTTQVRPGSHGHGAIMDERETARRVLATVGRQEAGAITPPRGPHADDLDAELDAIKARLRRSGRLRG